MRPRILMIDNDELTCNLWKTALEREAQGIVFTAHSQKGLPDLPHPGEISVLVVDPQAFHGQALDFMENTKRMDPSLKVIIVTASSERSLVLRALRLGVSNFHEKPLPEKELVQSVKSCLDELRLERDKKALLSQFEGRLQRAEGILENRLWFVSKAQSMGRVNESLTSLRREAMRGEGEEPSVMIYGERGTGSEGIAKMIHAGSRRGKKAWISINCFQYSGQSLETEFFGYEKIVASHAPLITPGLLELAQGGTLFLEKVEELDSDLRAKLLKAMKEKVFRRVGGSVDLKFDVRIISSIIGSSPYGEDVEALKRDEFIQQLSRVTLHLPPLRERPEDIGSMAAEFAERSFCSRGKIFPGFSPGFYDSLKTYSWPGNVLELFNFIERISILRNKGGPLEEGEFPLSEAQVHPGRGASSQLRLVPSPLQGEENSKSSSYTEMKKSWCNSFEKDYLVVSLKKHHGNVSAASREAKLDRSNFLRLLRRHGLNAQMFRAQDTDEEILQQAS